MQTCHWSHSLCVLGAAACLTSLIWNEWLPLCQSWCECTVRLSQSLPIAAAIYLGVYQFCLECVINHKQCYMSGSPNLLSFKKKAAWKGIASVSALMARSERCTCFVCSKVNSIILLLHSLSWHVSWNHKDWITFMITLLGFNKLKTNQRLRSVCYRA